MNHTYNLPGDFRSCRVEQGGFYVGTLSSTYSATQLYMLSGYNGQCGVLYGPLASPPSPPLASDALSVGGKVFARVGPASCILGGELFLELACVLHTVFLHECLLRVTL